MTDTSVADMLEQTFKDVDIVTDSRHNDRRKVTFWFTDEGEQND